MKEIRESYEDYLKAIWLISKKNRGGWCTNSEISEFLEVKPSSVTNMLYNLKDKGLISWKPRRSFRLTSKGRKIAEKMIDSYNLLKDFFENVLKIHDEPLVENLCCEIEHHLTPEVSEALEDFCVKFS
ncbi:MAG: metal-dependent transcriptional regulator [Candidatus Lokiarchaeota archaeon]|nr:metal-dependent transcriptional regulator [Candidatus Lokiarchaeota archaeon]MBD3342864.1 metal-dependent transcriptional regulator [Candidatus Lokiarchaeota archaeon]